MIVYYPTTQLLKKVNKQLKSGYMEMVNVNECQIRPYTLKELTQLYGVTKPTLVNWLKPFREQIGLKTGRYFTVRQIDTIFKHIGYPKNIDD